MRVKAAMGVQGKPILVPKMGGSLQANGTADETADEIPAFDLNEMYTAIQGAWEVMRCRADRTDYLHGLLLITISLIYHQCL